MPALQPLASQHLTVEDQVIRGVKCSNRLSGCHELGMPCSGCTAETAWQAVIRFLSLRRDKTAN